MAGEADGHPAPYAPSATADKRRKSLFSVCEDAFQSLHSAESGGAGREIGEFERCL